MLATQAERYVLHKLHQLDVTARESYATYSFPKGKSSQLPPYPLSTTAHNLTVVSALSNFANITLSSLYFDITKDQLYCHAENSHERRAIVTTMQQVGAPLR